ncbi:unnamed protein product [Effrenium voratum]|nr:unnamed protein product [Effrenium voratum]|mmetsp:Transcript_100132/g.238728  ORF Transcript_100132/g.238728 Transcript_100132/m.238728 type:complete len:518 (+) Transcript_100132:57-1610(+)|eukprot:CAMPEP_0181480556 /NCGR_PEP_ID=MMETSP1110-20121109/43863_1 /TAXON_ID=174948 /ORGANISM="Symbiodinium sp., Strain CCMP421" /LENGTH=517 /DNA_ID=CAMNT_0023606033 /DNA_START=54 /DNA_END=1607 /DNA_ORIENTATION=-
MARREKKVVLLCAVLALAFYSPSLGWSSAEDEQLKKTLKVWKQPHNLRIAGKSFAVDTVSQGSQQWQVRATESGNSSTALFAAREGGGQVTYGLNYDSTHSRYQPSRAKLGFAAATDEDGSNVDWTLRVAGKRSEPLHISMTGNGDDVLYEAAVGVERPLRGNVLGRYGLDIKRRPGQSWRPWLRHGLGLLYNSSVGEAKVNVFSTSEASNISSNEWAASLKGRLEGWSAKRGGKILSRDPQYLLRLSPNGLDALVRAPAKRGFAFGVNGHVSPKAEYDAEGYLEWDGKHEVINGLTLEVDTKASAKKGTVTLHPLGLTAVADLEKLAPKLAGGDSKVALRMLYKLDGDHPSLQGLASVSPAQVPQLRATGTAAYSDNGETSGALRVTMEDLHGVDARYELATAKGSYRHASEVRLPRVEFGGGSYLRGTGKFYKGSEWGEKPRVQLGVQYEGKVNVNGRSLDLGGESAAFDSGRSLLDEMGRPWTSPEMRKARNSAQVLRRRIASDFGEAQRWMEK